MAHYRNGQLIAGSGAGAQDADSLAFDNSGTTLSSTTAGAAIREISSEITIDFANAREDIQDVNSLLQKLLDDNYPGKIYLYNNGTINQTFTRAAISPNSAVAPATHLPSVTYNADNIYLTTALESDTWRTAYFYTSDKVNITNFNKVVFVIDAATSEYLTSYANVSVFSQAVNNNMGVVASEQMQNGQALYELNVSNISGDYFIGIGLSSNKSYASKIYIKQIYLM